MPSARRLAERLLLEQTGGGGDEAETSADTTSLSWSSTDDSYLSRDDAANRLLGPRGPPSTYGPGLIYPHPSTSSRPTAAGHAQARGAGRAPHAEVASDTAAPALTAEEPEGPSSAEKKGNGEEGQETKRDRSLRHGQDSDMAMDPELRKHAYNLRWHLSHLTEEGLERERRQRFGADDDGTAAKALDSEGAGTAAESSLRVLRGLPKRLERGLRASSGHAATTCRRAQEPRGTAIGDGFKQDEQDETEWEFVRPDGPPDNPRDMASGGTHERTTPVVIGVVAASSAVAAMGAMWRFAYNG